MECLQYSIIILTLISNVGCTSSKEENASKKDGKDAVNSVIKLDTNEVIEGDQDSLHVDLLRLYKDVMQDVLERKKLIKKMQDVMDKLPLLDEVLSRVQVLEEQAVFYKPKADNREASDDKQARKLAKDVQKQGRAIAKLQRLHQDDMAGSKKSSRLDKIEKQLSKVRTEVKDFTENLIDSAQHMENQRSDMSALKLEISTLDARQKKIASEFEWFRFKMHENTTYFPTRSSDAMASRDGKKERSPVFEKLVDLGPDDVMTRLANLENTVNQILISPDAAHPNHPLNETWLHASTASKFYNTLTRINISQYEQASKAEKMQTQLNILDADVRHFHTMLEDIHRNGCNCNLENLQRNIYDVNIEIGRLTRRIDRLQQDLHLHELKHGNQNGEISTSSDHSYPEVAIIPLELQTERTRPYFPAGNEVSRSPGNELSWSPSRGNKASSFLVSTSSSAHQFTTPSGWPRSSALQDTEDPRTTSWPRFREDEENLHRLTPNNKQCSIASVNNSQVYRAFRHIPTGTWMKDPKPRDKRMKSHIYVLRNAVRVSNIREYANEKDVRNNKVLQIHHLPFRCTGMGHVVYKGRLYCNLYQTAKLARYDLTSKDILRAKIRDAGHNNSFPYSSGVMTDIDVAVDERGLWVIYSSSANKGNIVVSRLHPDTLEAKHTWVTDFPKSNASEAFLTCAKLYVTKVEKDKGLKRNRIAYVYDTDHNKDMFPKPDDIPFETETSHFLTSLVYNPVEKKLYGYAVSKNWDGLLVTYDVNFN